MKRFFVLLYGGICYLIFLASFLYSIGFVGNFLVPRSIDVGPEASFTVALVINAVLLGLFAVQHSVMARQKFKEWLTQYIPGPAERPTYVLFSGLLLILLFWLWRPMTDVVWEFQGTVPVYFMWSIFGFGWFLVLISTFLIDHFHLFGLRQVWNHFHDNPPADIDFQTPGLYKYVRHPLMLGFLLAFWATPTMTAGHLLFAGLTTGYIFVGVTLEEQDLLTHFGDMYRRYRKKVPMLFPWKGKAFDASEGESRTDGNPEG